MALHTPSLRGPSFFSWSMVSKRAMTGSAFVPLSLNLECFSSEKTELGCTVIVKKRNLVASMNFEKYSNLFLLPS